MAMDCCERESIVFGGSGMGLNERSWRESPDRMLEASSASMYSYLEKVGLSPATVICSTTHLCFSLLPVCSCNVRWFTYNSRSKDSWVLMFYEITFKKFSSSHNLSKCFPAKTVGSMTAVVYLKFCEILAVRSGYSASRHTTTHNITV